jgi:hypothetical protein
MLLLILLVIIGLVIWGVVALAKRSVPVSRTTGKKVH